MTACIDSMVGTLAEAHGDALAREICLSCVDGRVSRVALPDQMLDSFVSLMGQVGLSVAVSDDLHVPKPDIGKGGYSNQCYASFDAGHPGAHRLLYVAQSPQRARKACRGEALDDDAILGEALRYPKCCTDLYEVYSSLAAEKHQGDLFPLSVMRSEAGIAASSLLNFAANYFGGGWCSFFPCSLHCDVAIKRLQHERKLVMRASRSLAVRLDAASSGAIIYTEFQGVAWLRRASLQHQEICYRGSEVVVTLEAPLQGLFSAVVEGDRVVPMPSGGFRVFAGQQQLWEERSYGSYARLFR